ncbi:MAG: hypothetical protein ABSC94_10505 [Polyangiaceae bacterium]|jgi:hypothetical protein
MRLIVSNGRWRDGLSHRAVRRVMAFEVEVAGVCVDSNVGPARNPACGEDRPSASGSPGGLLLGPGECMPAASPASNDTQPEGAASIDVLMAALDKMLSPEPDGDDGPMDGGRAGAGS